MTTPGASFLSARTRSAPQGFGRPVPRKEDARLVTGLGRFSDDRFTGPSIALPPASRAVRSPGSWLWSWAAPARASTT